MLPTGLLRCDGVDSNTCDQGRRVRHRTPRNGLGGVRRSREISALSGRPPGERGCKNTAETCAHGILARYKLRIPESTKASAHTILSYRWDTQYENNEVFVGLRGLAITTDGGAPVTTPTPRRATVVALRGVDANLH